METGGGLSQKKRCGKTLTSEIEIQENRYGGNGIYAGQAKEEMREFQILLFWYGNCGGRKHIVTKDEVDKYMKSGAATNRPQEQGDNCGEASYGWRGRGGTVGDG